MCARKLKYASDDELPLFATPEEAMREGNRQEEERRRRHMEYQSGKYVAPINSGHLAMNTGASVPMTGNNAGGNRMSANMRTPMIRNTGQMGGYGDQSGYQQAIPHPQQQNMAPPQQHMPPPPQQQMPPQQQVQQQQNVPPYNGRMGPSQHGYQQGPQHPPQNCIPHSSQSLGGNRPVYPAPHGPPPIQGAGRQPQYQQLLRSEPSNSFVNPSPTRNNMQQQQANSNGSSEDQDAITAKKLFYNHDVRKQERLTAEELQNLLQNDDNTQFCMSSIDALISLFGAARFGTVNLSEFTSLYKRVKRWRMVYVDNDINGSFTITVNEFHNSLQELGYVLPIEVTENLFEQYAEFINSNKNVKELKFDRFVESLVWLMKLTKVFRKYDEHQDGIATIHFKDFIDSSLYLGRFLPN